MVIVRETENELNNGCNKFKDYFTHTFFHVNILKHFQHDDFIAKVG